MHYPGMIHLMFVRLSMIGTFPLFPLRTRPSKQTRKSACMRCVSECLGIVVVDVVVVVATAAVVVIFFA